MTNTPEGSYTYGDSAHLDAATSTIGGYTASYDASGNMLCRAPSSATTCAGTPTGAQLAYDNEGRLTSWQNTPTSPTSTDGFLYDGQGNRVLQQSPSGGGFARSCPSPTSACLPIGQVQVFMGQAYYEEAEQHVETAATTATLEGSQSQVAPSVKPATRQKR